MFLLPIPKEVFPSRFNDREDKHVFFHLKSNSHIISPWGTMGGPIQWTTQPEKRLMPPGDHSLLCGLVGFGKLPCFKLPPAGAFFLIPVDSSTAALTGPFLLLSFEPLLEAVYFDELEIGFHGPVVRPLVIHESVEILTGKVLAGITEIEAFFPGAGPEPALLHISIYSLAPATPAILCPAGPAKDTAGTVL